MDSIGQSARAGEPWPLVHPFVPDRPTFWTSDGPITGGRLLRRAARLARALPDRAFAVNYCEAKDGFAVALLATWMRGQTAIFPADRTERNFALLSEDHDDLYCLTDGPLPAPAAAHVRLEIDDNDRADANTADVADVADVADAALALDRIAIKIFTSGTTGKPKANDKSFGMLVAGAKMLRRLLDLPDDRDGAHVAPNVSIVATVPSQHMYGFETSMMSVLQAAASVHVERPVYPADVARCLREVPAPRMLVTTPVHLRALIESGATFAALDRIVSATGPLSPELAQAAERHFNASVWEIYGFTEFGSVASRRTTRGQVWRLRDDFIARDIDGKPLVEWSPFDVGMPFPDMVEIVDPRHVRLRGRVEDNVNIAGKSASLAGLTARLLEVDGVEDGAFWLPAEDRGLGIVSRLVAFVVAPHRGQETIRRELSRRMDPAFVPRTVVHVDALPRNATGKLSQDALRQLAAAHSTRHGAT